VASADRTPESGGPGGPPSLTPSQENYLEAIYELSRGGSVQVKTLADHVGVRRPSVSRAVAELARLRLVDHRAYGDIELTRAGEELGRHLARRSACLRRFLVDVLGMDADEAEAEAHRLEHGVGIEVLSRLEILNEFALSSDAWMRRLAVRLGRVNSDEPRLPYRLGKASMHAGDVAPTEARSRSDDS
jgi:DtxR family Mn-dependent transcriptional regulator